jgi:outer membrane receptor protein involved in Fe transport
MLYADFSTSYRAQGMTESEQPPPEKLKAYSLGAKNRFFNDRLQLNASAFYYDYENYPASVNVMAYIGDDFDNPMSNDVTNDGHQLRCAELGNTRGHRDLPSRG